MKLKRAVCSLNALKKATSFLYSSFASYALNTSVITCFFLLIFFRGMPWLLLIHVITTRKHTRSLLYDDDDVFTIMLIHPCNFEHQNMECVILFDT